MKIRQNFDTEIQNSLKNGNDEFSFLNDLNQTRVSSKKKADPTK